MVNASILYCQNSTTKEVIKMSEKSPPIKRGRGRPKKISPEFSELVKTKSVDALERLMSITEDSDAKPETVIKACETVMAYGYGKPTNSSGDKDSDVKVVIDYE